jgi:uncharacterized protein YjbK
MAIERELKLALSEPDAARLAEVLGPPQAILHQRNHYLDTAQGTLRRLGHGLRLREEDGRRRLTLKGPSHPAGAMTERLELEVAVTPADADLLLAGARSIGELPLPVPDALARETGPQRLRVLGMIENERRVFRLRLGERPPGEPTEAEVELDRTHYPDGSVTHELEVEWPHPTAPFPERAVRALLDRAGVPWRPQTKSKLARFLETSGLSGATP